MFVFFLSVIFVTDSTMINHHVSPPFGDFCLNLFLTPQQANLSICGYSHSDPKSFLSIVSSFVPRFTIYASNA